MWWSENWSPTWWGVTVTFPHWDTNSGNHNSLHHPGTDQSCQTGQQSHGVGKTFQCFVFFSDSFPVFYQASMDHKFIFQYCCLLSVVLWWCLCFHILSLIWFLFLRIGKLQAIWSVDKEATNVLHSSQTGRCYIFTICYR